MSKYEVPADVLAYYEQFLQERKSEAEDGIGGQPKHYHFPRAEAASEARQLAGGGRRVHHGKQKSCWSE